MDKSYLSSRSDNLINNQINNKNMFDIEYIDEFNFKIKPIPFQDNTLFGRVWHNSKGYNFDKEYKINLFKDIKDGIGLIQDRFYFLYANINIYKKEITEFFLVKQAIAYTSTSATFTKGNQVTVYLINNADNNAYQFEEGARICIWSSEDYIGGAGEKNNLGTIISIDSSTTLTILLDNNNYGASFNGLAYIIQLNKFIPKRYNSATNKYIICCNNYSLMTAGIHSFYNIDTERAELTKFSYDYKHQAYTGLEFDIWYGVGDSSSYNRWVFPFYCIPPTAHYFWGQNRFGMSYTAGGGYNYGIVEFWIEDKNEVVQYRDLYGLAPYDQSYYWHQGSIYGYVKECCFKYEEKASFTAYSNMVLRIMRIHGFEENI